MEVSKMASTIQIRVDDDLKSKSYNGFPFEIKRTVHNPYTSMIEDEMLQRLEQS